MRPFVTVATLQHRKKGESAGDISTAIARHINYRSSVDLHSWSAEKCRNGDTRCWV